MITLFLVDEPHFFFFDCCQQLTALFYEIFFIKVLRKAINFKSTPFVCLLY